MTTTTTFNPETATDDEAAAYYLQAIRDADARAACIRREFDRLASALPLFHETKAAEAQATKLREEAREFFAAQNRAVVTSFYGKVGMQARRSVTHSPAAVRELAPEIAHLVIDETVNGTNLKKFVGTLVKSGKAAANLLDLLEARAEVKTTYAFICQPADPATAESTVAQQPADERAPF